MHIGTSAPIGDGKPQGSRESLLWNERTSEARREPLRWWYELAAPAEPLNASARDRERVRAGRLSSIILLILLFFGASQLPNAFSGTNHAFQLILLTAMAINVGAFVFNRLGHVMAVGIMMVMMVEAAFILVVLTSPTPLSARSLTTFYLIVLTELIAVSLLPPKSVFLVALCNIFFTWAAITFLHHTADFQLTTPAAYYSALASPLVLQGITAIVTYLWAQGARQAIERAERVAALEHALAERDRAAAEQKQQLELGIQQILQTHVQAANGNFDVRAPLARENVLWQVAYSLNNLLARLQRANQSENELQRVDAEINRLTVVVREAKVSRRPVRVTKGGSVLDTLIQEISGSTLQ